MHRVPRSSTAGYDSGSMPFAQYHYPFENKEAVRIPIPRRFHIRSGRSDARMVLFASCDLTLLFDCAPYKRNRSRSRPGRDGRRCRNQRGNTVDPFDALKRQAPTISACKLLHEFRAVAALKIQRPRRYRGTAQIPRNSLNTYAFWVLYAPI